MGYINPLFTNIEITKEKKTLPVQTAVSKQKNRAPRKDRTHDLKFPVSSITQMKLKSYLKQAQRLAKMKGQVELKQTKFNTLLLQFGLKHKEILNWNHEYRDTKVYMHTTLLETEYLIEIGGPHGLAIQKNRSERKVVYHIILSVLNWLEGGGSLEAIL